MFKKFLLKNESAMGKARQTVLQNQYGRYAFLYTAASFALGLLFIWAGYSLMM